MVKASPFKKVAVSQLRSAEWIKQAGFAPQVFVFRNLESGQVVYSQFPKFDQEQILDQFQRPNWQNKKPSTRRDIWKCMCVIDMPDYQSSVKVYQNLVKLRYLRDVSMKKEANSLRKKNSDGNVWYSSQYRPTYAQESVADMIEALSKVDKSITNQKITIHWEDLWRMGDKSKYWEPILPNVEHSMINRIGNTSREESVILKELGEKAKSQFAKLSSSSQELNVGSEEVKVNSF